MIYIDFETYNDVPIKHGTYRYTSSCEPMVCTYAWDGGEATCWDITAQPKMPADLRYLLLDTDEPITAHSAMFDRNALRYGLKIEIPIPRWRCTMVKALAHGLPGGLEILCDILKVDADLAKHKDGRRLIHLFCKPRPKNSIIKRATRLTHPVEWAQFLAYATADITAMREVDRKLPSWNYSGHELALWHLDQTINDRGMCVDVEFAEAAIKAVAREQKKLAGRTQELTADAIASTTQRDQLLAHLLLEYGVELPDLQMATVERRLSDPDLPVELRELLSIRLQASSTSTSKYASLVRGVQADGRLRGTLQFDGAARTRRPAGRTFQPTNLPRPDLPHEEIDTGIEAIKLGVADVVVGDVMRLTRNAVRGCITAPPGRKLVIADLANIEGRDAAWLAGEAWKLQAFRDFDAGIGPDLYKMSYGRAFSVSPDFDAKSIEGYLKRQIGKVLELMMQYGGGVGAFITGAATYGIDLEQMAAAAGPAIPADVWEESERMLAWTIKNKRSTFGLSAYVFKVCDSLKRLWRRQHPAIVSVWAALEDAARKAINCPGNTFDVSEFVADANGNPRPLAVAPGTFKVRRDGAWLRIALPSGACLCYPSPQVSDKGDISYMGMNQYTKKWSRIKTYGGKIFENACQGFAGDLLRSDWHDVEDAGYQIVLTVYDENVTETPDSSEFNVDALVALMVREKSYAKGLPLAASGFETHRYRKE